jgi:putative transposase
LNDLEFVDMGSVRGYHFSNSRESRETRRVPQVPVFGTWVLGLVFPSGEFSMPVGLKRYCGKGDLHFITFSCYRRLPLLKTVRARDIFVKELGKIRDEMGFQLVGYVVMPEHVHLLISEPKEGTPSTVLQKLKLRVSRKLRRQRRSSNAAQLRLPFDEGGEPLRAFWQGRFYDFNVYTRGKKTEKLNYMHANPVIRGLVEHPKDWRWSSWGFY